MRIPRLQLVELEDLSWFPSTIRDLATDYLVFLETRFGLQHAIIPILEDVVRRSGESRILDLCSGAGGPALAVREGLAERGLDIDVCLTDLFPNLRAFERGRATAPRRVSFVTTPVNALDIDPELPGIRTLFNAFHHFPPTDARRILEAAAADGRSIAIFDLPDRSIRSLIPFFFTPLFVWLATPFMRPFSWRRLLFTYIVPLVPLTCLWDGLVSHLRSYGVEGLERLADGAASSTHAWRAGRAPVPGTPGHITYLIGVPASERACGPRVREDRGASSLSYRRTVRPRDREPDSTPTRETRMAAYTCDKCGMSIGTMTCGQCGAELVHETLTRDDGSSVHVSKCPEGHGMVKSPMCCGQDMSCTV